jgi:hypothetical protein
VALRAQEAWGVDPGAVGAGAVGPGFALWKPGARRWGRFVYSLVKERTAWERDCRPSGRQFLGFSTVRLIYHGYPRLKVNVDRCAQRLPQDAAYQGLGVVAGPVSRPHEAADFAAVGIDQERGGEADNAQLAGHFGGRINVEFQ